MAQSRALPGTTINNSIQGPNGEPVFRVHTFPVQPGQRLRVVFEEVNAQWRQGMFIATEGSLALANVSSRALVRWQDSAPPGVDIDVVESNGTITLYNVWDSGRNLGRFESLKATSGMLVERIEPHGWRYRCNDIGFNPDFKKLVVRVDLVDEAPADASS